MIVNEKALVKAMEKAAASGGYRVCFDSETGEIAIYAEEWFVKVNTAATPRKVIGLLAEHFGYVPEEGCFEVQKPPKEELAIVQIFQPEVFQSTANGFCHGITKLAGWLPATAWGLALAMDCNRRLYAVKPELTALETIESILSIPEESALCWQDDDSFLAILASTAGAFDGKKAVILAALEKIEWSPDTSNAGRGESNVNGQMEIGDGDEVNEK